MPILSGRVLAVGQIDAIGILLASAVLFWIPTHTLTFSLKFFDDYQAAGVPTFPSTYGEAVTRFVIALSSVIASLTMALAAVWIGVTAGVLRLMIVLSAGLFFLAVTTVFRPSERVNFSLFKYASMYMTFAMLLIIP
jgi:heme O synthase-like polyprenyltransferase